VEKFWLEAYRILVGLRMFLKNDIVHHDLKHPNMVYNEKTNRIAFIDFGLMTKKSTIMKHCRENTYGYGTFHWSFPWELYYLNRPRYLSIAAANGQVKLNKIKDFIDLIKMGPDANRFSSSVSTFLNNILDPKASTAEKDDETRIYIKAYSKFLNEIKPEPEEYEKILKQSVETIDSYGVGMGFMYVLHRCGRFLEDDIYEDLHRLFTNMTWPIVTHRNTVDETIADYQEIMENEGLMAKYKKRFDSNGKMVDDVPLPPSIERAIKSIRPRDVLIPPRELSRHLTSPVRQCPDGKEYNPFTKRCVKPCKAEHSRDANFKCRKTRKEHSSQASTEKQKPCPAGKERNPTTKRCVKTCKAGYHRNANFKCVKN
jgi:serine/threonine protein kinase